LWRLLSVLFAHDGLITGLKIALEAVCCYQNAQQQDLADNMLCHTALWLCQLTFPPAGKLL